MKKIIAIILGVIMAISLAACNSQTEASEVHCPGLIGLEHLDAVKGLNDRHAAGEIKMDYEIKMGQCEGYWVVYLEGEVGEDTYAAGGFYNHMPSDEELDILWNNKVPYDQFMDLLSGLGF